MSCRLPITMYRDKRGRNPETGAWPLVSSINDGYKDLSVQIPCGRCIYCRLENSRQKTVRITHELNYHSTASFLTLTYTDIDVPRTSRDIPTLTRGSDSDITLFLKRLRDYLRYRGVRHKIKYFQCGEYGETTWRPHHHMILYGFDFSHDRVVADRNPVQYQSDTLDKLWKKGGCRIGTVTWNSASYVASYCVKKLTGDKAKEVYDSMLIEPPYMTSSLALGRQWISDWLYDVYPRDRISIRGHFAKPPRYYDDYLKKADPCLHKKVIIQRQKQERPDDYFDRGLEATIKKSKEVEFWKNPKI